MKVIKVDFSKLKRNICVGSGECVCVCVCVCADGGSLNGKRQSFPVYTIFLNAKK